MDHLVSMEWVGFWCYAMANGKAHQVVWDPLLNYGRIEWQRTLHDLEKVAYEDILKEFDKVWCVKDLIVTHSDLMITWKNESYFLSSLRLWCLWGGCGLSRYWIGFNMCPKRKEKKRNVAPKHYSYEKFYWIAQLPIQSICCGVPSSKQLSTNKTHKVSNVMSWYLHLKYLILWRKRENHL